MNLPQLFILSGLRLYQLAVSPVLTAVFGPMGGGCRFSPTCSRYAMEAVRTHGAWAGGALAVRRLCRCHPWGGAGLDLVPPRHAARSLTLPIHGAPPSPHGS